MNKHPGALVLCLCLVQPLAARGQLVISDTLTGASSSYGWLSLNGACLTAGNNTGSIPACVGLPYYAGRTLVGGNSGRLPDAVGRGALRLTNGDTGTGSNGNNQTGAVVSTTPFPANQGVQVTFTTVTYGGNGFGNSLGQGSGADGITFYLSDGALAPSVGALGGSMGYSCSNVNSSYNGVQGGYLGVGIDEYGNFTNASDGTASGPGARPGSISVRGAGNVNWTWLSTQYPNLYPANADQATAVRTTCRTGKLYNASNATQSVGGNFVESGRSSNVAVLDYPLLATNQLASNVTIFNQQAVSMPLRGFAKPITYTLNITAGGVLNMSYSLNGGLATPVIANQSITASNGVVPASFRFGFSGGTGSGSNVHEITCFKAAQLNAASSSAGVNGQQSARVEAGTQLYLAYYHPINWWGQLTATSLNYTAATDTVSFNSTPNWDANCLLTGGACASTGTSNTALSPASRVLMSWNGSAGVALQWAELSSDQRSALQDVDHLNYLRGERSHESTPTVSTSLRARTGVLGDIMNSSPSWVGAPVLPYRGPWSDALHAGAMPEGVSYAAFAASRATRTNVVYAGANDGLLHGFRAGTQNADGSFNAASPNDGQELIGYMPDAVSATIRNSTATLDFTSPQYAHAVFVDATPGTGDLFYAGHWHSWLVGGLGAGSNIDGPLGDTTHSATRSSIFVLDITDPDAFSEAHASQVVLGDWGPTTLPDCVNAPDACKLHLGNTYGPPIIRRLHDGNWAVLFGNGLNSSAGTAGIFIMTVRQSDGAKSFRFLDTGVGPSADPLHANAKNGIAYVASADLDSDHVTDYVYAGDAFGNVWRFDLTSDDPGAWAAAASPLFSTSAGQAITTSVSVSAARQKVGPPRVMVNFGTGQRLPQTTLTPATYAPAGQSLYGVWDWNMGAWNALNSTPYLSLSGPQTLNPSVLQTQTATDVTGGSDNISGYRTVTMQPVCWRGGNACASGQNTQFGWKLALPGANEQVIYNPTSAYGLFIVNTTLPAVNDVLTCASQPPSGFTMAIAMDTGGSPKTSFFADASNNYISSSGLLVAGIGLSATGTPSFVTAMTKPYMVNQTASGVGNITQVNPGASGIGRRLNWIKLR